MDAAAVGRTQLTCRRRMTSCHCGTKHYLGTRVFGFAFEACTSDCVAAAASDALHFKRRERTINPTRLPHAELAIYAPSWMSLVRIPRRVGPVLDTQA